MGPDSLSTIRNASGGVPLLQGAVMELVEAGFEAQVTYGWQLTTLATSERVRPIRKWVRDRFENLGLDSEFHSLVELTASELVTNVFKHVLKPDIVVEVAMLAGALPQIIVRDTSDDSIKIGTPDDLDVSGRGLLMIEALGGEISQVMDEEGGKIVCVTLRPKPNG